jgi:hypothetical protein
MEDIWEAEQMTQQSPPEPCPKCKELRAELEAAKARLRLFDAPCADVADLYEEEEEPMTDDQKDIRNAAIEEAAKRCDLIRPGGDYCAERIRELKTKEAE